MIVVFGKGKVGNGVAHLLSLINREYVIMDDQDLDDTILTNADTILVSPGVKQSHVIYQKYTSKIQSELQFLSTLLSSIAFSKEHTWIGITATNGKSTTTRVTYQVLKTMFPEKNVWIAGNFDVPVSEVLAQIIEQGKQSEDHIFVVECSSFMLYGLRNFAFDYSILLNIARDHLDWHKDFDEYQESKFTLLRRTHRAFFVPQSTFDTTLDAGLKKMANVVEETFDLSSTQFLGKHNQTNLATVKALILRYCDDIGLDEKTSQYSFSEILSKVTPLPHRLGLLRKFENINIYDDGICTSSHSLSAALSSFDEKLVLIAGGYDKGDDYLWLRNLFLQKVGYAILMGQTAPKLAVLCEQSQIPYIVVSSLEEAVQAAVVSAKHAQLKTVLFSPGAASFDMFKNVYDRVDKFVGEVNSLS